MPEKTITVELTEANAEAILATRRGDAALIDGQDRIRAALATPAGDPPQPPEAMLERALRLAMKKHREDPALAHAEIAEYACRILYPLAVGPTQPDHLPVPEEGETCHSCGEPVAATCPTYWLTDDDLWSEVEGGPNGIRCIRCFALDCQQAGIPIYWRALREPEHPAVPRCRECKGKGEVPISKRSPAVVECGRCGGSGVEPDLSLQRDLEAAKAIFRADAGGTDSAWGSLSEKAQERFLAMARAALRYGEPDPPAMDWIEDIGAVPEHVEGDRAKHPAILSDLLHQIHESLADGEIDPASNSELVNAWQALSGESVPPRRGKPAPDREGERRG